MYIVAPFHESPAPGFNLKRVLKGARRTLYPQHSLERTLRAVSQPNQNTRVQHQPTLVNIHTRPPSTGPNCQYVSVPPHTASPHEVTLCTAKQEHKIRGVCCTTRTSFQVLDAQKQLDATSDTAGTTQGEFPVSCIHMRTPGGPIKAAKSSSYQTSPLRQLHHQNSPLTSDKR